MSDPSDEEIEREWERFDGLSTAELAHRWLNATHEDEIVMYAYEIWERKGATFYAEWLAALITSAEGEDEIGGVAAGPVEASLERNIELARAVTSLVFLPKLQAVLRGMWFDDAIPEVKRWAIDVLRAGSVPSDAIPMPRGLETERPA